MPTLSVACATSAPGPRVACVLSQVSDVADEVIVAVDSRLDPDLLGDHALHADRLVRFEFAEPSERVWPWLLAQCSGDWILWLDGNEVLSSTVVKGLAHLLHARDVVQYRLPCHVVTRRRLRLILEPGPSPDEPRLVRNDPATLWAPGVPGSAVESTFPGRHLERGYYRTDHPRAPAEPRTASKGRSARIPLRDRRLVSTALRRTALTEIRGLTTADAVTLIQRAEIDRLWPERALPADAYDASISFLDVATRLTICAPRPVHVRVTNRGSERWPGSMRHPLIRLAHRWLRVDDTPLGSESNRTSLPGALAPGGSAIIRAHLVPPPEPGPYVLEFDLVHEFVRWFECAARVDVAVERAGT